MSFISDFDAIVDYPGLKPAELGLLVYFFRNQGESFIFHRTNILKKFCIKKDAYYTALNGLRDKNLITYEQLNEGKYGGLRITINMSVILSESGKTVSGKTVSGKTVSGKSESGKTVSGKTVSGKTVSGKSESGKTVSGKTVSGKTVSGKSGRNKGINIEWSKSSKGVNGVREGDSVPAAPCDTIPAGTQTSLLPPDIPPASIPEPEKASTKFIPPTKAEVRAKLVAVLTEKGTIQHWTESDLQSFTDRFYDWYDSAHWLKNDGRKMKDWQRALSVTWLAKREYLPEKATVPAFPGAPVNQQRQPPKSFKQQDLDYANRRFNDPAGAAIRAAVDACLGMGGDDPCEYGLPEQYREQAVKLLQEERRRLSQQFNPFPDFPELP